MKIRIPSAIVAVSLIGASSILFAQPRNIILFIGDGMGPGQIEAARLYKGAPLSFETLPYQGECTTRSESSSITDSAAAATSIATGAKVNNGVISLAIPGDGNQLETMLELFKKRGKTNGLVSTAYLTHATPAAFGAHQPSRNNTVAIGDDLMTRSQPNILFGGGGNGLSSDAAIANGYEVAIDSDGFVGLDATAPSKRLCALFGSYHMPYEEDYLGSNYPYPHLTDMVLKALDALEENADGFFLMVEAGRIDHACHSNLLPEAVHETLELDRAVAAALTWREEHPDTDTLILVTADHETGGLSVIQDKGRDNYPDVSWSSTGHTGVNVPVFAVGPDAELVVGTMDNTGFLRLVTLENGTDPGLYRVSVQDLADTTATIVWNTDEASDSMVEFRPLGSSVWQSVFDPATTTTHRLDLTGLTASETYEYQVTSTTGTGTGTSAIYSFAPFFDPDAPLTIVSEGSMWKYYDKGTDLGIEWRALDYIDGSWLEGAAQLGYGDGDESTVVGYGKDYDNKHPTTYFRHSFTVADPTAYGALELRLLRDDGAVVYLNGTEVHRVNMPTGSVEYSTMASSAHDFGWDLSVPISNVLLTGANVLAVEIHQGTAGSSDISLDLELTAADPNAVQILKGPYLQSVTDTSITVMWETDVPSGSRVDFGVGGSDELVVEDETPVTIHEVTLTGLNANTAYLYTVASGNAVSADSSFTTPPPPGSDDNLRIAIYGDTRTSTSDHAAVAAAITQNNPLPRCILHVGDFVEDGLEEGAWATEFFTPAADMLRQIPLFPVLGNHEYSDSDNGQMWYFDLFDTPANGTDYGNEEWYAFTQGSVRLIVLNTNAPHEFGSQQYTWLLGELQSVEYAATTWQIIFFHHPPYSDRIAVDVRTHLVPLFHEHGIDIVFSGHDHNYRHVKVSDPVFGTTIDYVVTGGGGAPLYAPAALEPDPLRTLIPIWAEAVLHHCILDATPNSLLFRALKNDGTEIDSFVLILENDTIPPVISDVTADPSDFTATITWNTDEAADSQVQYRIPVADPQVGWNEVSDSAFPVTHWIQLTGLVSDTTYEYRVNSTDASGNSQPIPLDLYTFTTLKENFRPVAADQAFAIDEEMPLYITVHATDVNDDDDSLTYEIDDAPAHGSLSGTLPVITYTPDLDFSGSDSFTFTASDGWLTSEPGTVSITVNPVDPTPASIDAFVMGNPTMITGKVEGDFSTLRELNDGGQTLTELKGGVFGRMEAQYRLETIIDPSQIRTVTLQLDFVSLPVADDLSWTVSAWNGVSWDVIGQLAEEIGTLAQPLDPEIYVAADGAILIMITDGGDIKKEAYDSIVIDRLFAAITTSLSPEPNGFPSANPQSVNCDKDQFILVTLTGSDPNGDNLSYRIVDGPSAGTADLNGDQVTYTPTLGYLGADSFTFEVSDGNDGTDTAAITITVKDQLASPVIHVQGIEMGLTQAGKNWKGTAIITIVDKGGLPVAGASVSGDWSFDGGAIGAVSGLTDASGSILLSSSPVKTKLGGTFGFTVADVVLSGSEYDSAANGESSDLIDIP